MDRYKRYTPYTCSREMRDVGRCSRDTSEFCICDKQTIPLAMAYVKDQKFKELYSSAEALNNGTLFFELYKPYCIGGRRR